MFDKNNVNHLYILYVYFTLFYYFGSVQISVRRVVYQAVRRMERVPRSSRWPYVRPAFAGYPASYPAHHEQDGHPAR